jgi:hypothetical protein
MEKDIMWRSLTEHLRTYVGWVNGCVLLGTILAAGLGAMALTGGDAVQTEPVADTQPAEHATNEKRLARGGTYLGYQILY